MLRKLNGIKHLSLCPLLFLLAVGGAFATPLSTGTVSYTFTGLSADLSCTSQQRESFSGIVTDTGESISGATLNFSICNDPDSFAGGIFSVTSGLSIAEGTITASDLGDAVAAGFDTETIAGSFLVTSGTGDFAASEGDSELFTATVVENLSTGAGTGSFTVGVPEPVTMVLSCLGISLIALAKRRRDRNNLL